MRALRLAAVLACFPLAGCIVAIDHGGRKGLEKRVEKIEKRAERLERERGMIDYEAPAKRSRDR
jgi:hypothetical protein